MIALRHFAPIFLCLAHWSFENHNCISTSKDCSMFCSIYFIKIFDYFHFEVNYTFFRYGNIHHTVDYFRLEICHLGNFGFHYKRNEIVYISDPEKTIEYPWLHSPEKNFLLDKILHKLPFFGSFSPFFKSSLTTYLIFPNEFFGLFHRLGHSLEGKMYLVESNENTPKILYFWTINTVHFIKHEPLIAGEWLPLIN